MRFDPSLRGQESPTLHDLLSVTVFKRDFAGIRFLSRKVAVTTLLSNHYLTFKRVCIFLFACYLLVNSIIARNEGIGNFINMSIFLIEIIHHSIISISKCFCVMFAMLAYVGLSTVNINKTLSTESIYQQLVDSW